MTITHGYTDNATLIAYLGTVAAASTTQVDMAINAASRCIDDYCNRRFWLDGTVVARTFEPTGGLMLLNLNADIGDTTGLIIKTDASGDGTFETTWASTDYQLLPVDASYASPEPKPWTHIRATGAKTFPWLVNTWLTRLDRVQITAKWGWPAVPDTITQACIIKAARLFLRKNSLQGIAAFDSYGPVRLSRQEDADVIGLIDSYRRQPVLVA